MKKIILVTGAAGFIGSQLCAKLLMSFPDCNVVGIDNLNNYYNSNIKKKKIKFLKKNKNFIFLKIDISDYNKLKKLFKKKKIYYVFNLAAQAGVRYSIENPDSYLNSNVIGFFNILKICKEFKVKNLFFASTSSVYGNNKKNILKEDDNTDNPLSFYAATKKSNEVMAYSYHYMFNLSIVGFRFFTVYGPNGRPDMSILKFLEANQKGKKIQLFNKGNHSRDFTYVEDCVDAMILVFKKLLKRNNLKPYFNIFNISSNKKIKLMKVISILEKNLNSKFQIEKLNLQKGDVKNTFGSINKIKKFSNYKPSVSIETGIKKIIEWHKKINQDK
jgi:UDP-glucuronate 4-epimerase